MVGSSVVESPCLCLDYALIVPSSLMSTHHHKSSAAGGGGGELGLFISGNSMAKKHFPRQLTSSFTDSWQDSRLSSKPISSKVNRCSKKQRRSRKSSLVVVSELAGQYEDSFEDVKRQILNYFTYKAVRVVMNQLYEMNPTQYRWMYDFVVNNKPGDGKQFIRKLGKEKHELAERVMVTRLHLYGKWIKKCDHAAMYNEISNENLALMRERLMETVIWPSDDTNTEKIG